MDLCELCTFPITYIIDINRFSFRAISDSVGPGIGARAMF